MPGKLVVHGFNEMVVGGTVDILLNDEKVGSVERGETAEFPIQKDSHLVVKCGINPLKAKLDKAAAPKKSTPRRTAAKAAEPGEEA